MTRREHEYEVQEPMVTANSYLVTATSQREAIAKVLAEDWDDVVRLEAEPDSRRKMTARRTGKAPG